MVNQHQAALSAIGVDNANKAHLLEKARVLFEEHKSWIGEGNCEGRDLLGMTCGLLGGLGLRVTIASPQDLDDFMTLNPDEIKMICREKNLGPSIAGQFPDIEALIMFSINTSLERLDALLPFISNSLANRLIKKPKDFASWLIELSDERCAVICGALEDRLPEIIKKPHKNLPVFRKDLREYFPEIGMQFDRCYFDSLLAQLDEKAKQLKDGGREQMAARVLSEALRHARDNYFNEAMTESSYRTFKAACTDALAQVSRDIGDASWPRLFKTTFITILFWPAPLASAIKSKYETGRFRYRFFDPPTLKTRDELLTAVKAIAPENSR